MRAALCPPEPEECRGRGRFLASIGNLDSDPLENLVAETGEAAERDRFDQYVEVARSDDDGWATFVEVAPENAVGLRVSCQGMKAAPCE